jgi:hypothetical protein
VQAWKFYHGRRFSHIIWSMIKWSKIIYQITQLTWMERLYIKRSTGRKSVPFTPIHTRRGLSTPMSKLKFKIPPQKHSTSLQKNVFHYVPVKGIAYVAFMEVRLDNSASKHWINVQSFVFEGTKSLILCLSCCIEKRYPIQWSSKKKKKQRNKKLNACFTSHL